MGEGGVRGQYNVGKGKGQRGGLFKVQDQGTIRGDYPRLIL